jgi:hypothetical protein
MVLAFVLTGAFLLPAQVSAADASPQVAPAPSAAFAPPPDVDVQPDARLLPVPGDVQEIPDDRVSPPAKPKCPSPVATCDDLTIDPCIRQQNCPPPPPPCGPNKLVHCPPPCLPTSKKAECPPPPPCDPARVRDCTPPPCEGADVLCPKPPCDPAEDKDCTPPPPECEKGDDSCDPPPVTHPEPKPSPTDRPVPATPNFTG